MYGKDSPIGVFDSGMGGVSVLRKLSRVMPGENFIYFGDSVNAPYGTKSKEEIKALTEKAFDFLRDKGCKAVVIACNTATSAAAKHLREKYPDYSIIGLEPALKPAALSMDYPKVLAMATPLTLKEEKFNSLMAQYEDQAEFIKLPAPELVKYIESGELDSEEEIQYLEEILTPYKDGKVDAVVLGCTHFPFARKTIQRILGDDVLVFDGGLGAARQTRRVLEGKNLLNGKEEGGAVNFINSIPEKTEIAKKLFYYKG
ncbi:MAG: glutamate racemase [Clostridia bacterium]|nr:glutamate racemase [Clostridia bacterium]